MRHYTTFLMSLALASSSLLAWSHRPAPIPQPYDSQEKQPPVYAFPLNPNQKWLMEESYLCMKPFQGELDYATKTHFVQPTDSTRFTHIKVKKPNFQWDSGVRVALGTYLPSSDRWDFKAVGTYFYGETTSKATADTSIGEAINPAYLPDLLFSFPATKTHFYWQLNYFTTDLELGREYQMTPQLVVHPFFGVRGTFIYQKAKTHDFAPEPNEPPVDQQIARYRLRLCQDVYGVGPRIGSRLNFYLGHHWQIVGNFAASFLYAHYDVHERFINEFTDAPSGTGLSITATNKAKDSDEMVKTNLEGSLGLGWETWVNNNKVRIAPSLLFEGTLWLNFNKFFIYNIPTLQPLSVKARDFDTIRRHGNFGLIGASFNFHVDF